MHGATVTAPDQQILDQWAPLSHKVPLSGVRAQTLAPTWVPAESQRRLAAYKVLAAYLGNVARWHLPASVTPDEAAERREYGDPALIVDRVKAAVLGEEWTVVVDGADDDIPDRPTIPDPPAEPAEGAPEIERRIFTLATERHEAEITELVDEWEAAWREQPQLQQVQDWLRAWATDEMLAAVITEAEGDICGLGDGVYVLSNSATRRRPTVTDRKSVV